MRVTSTNVLAALSVIAGSALLSGCQATLVAVHAVAPWAGDIIDSQKADTDAALKATKDDAGHATDNDYRLNWTNAEGSKTAGGRESPIVKEGSQ